MRWRRSLIRFIDQNIKRNRIHQNLAVLKEYYALPVETQLNIQEQRLKGLLRHAAFHVPYYRNTLDEAGVISNDHIDLSHFHRIPFLTKEILKSEYEQLQSDDLFESNWYRNTSGGSTGAPVTFIQDNIYRDLNLATAMYQFDRAGLRSGDAYVKLWGSERDILQGGIGWRAKTANFVRNRVFLNSFSMSEADMAQYASLIQRLKPALIEAYSHSAYELARFINKNSVHIEGVKSVISSAGNLHPFMRREIQKAFNCEVFNRYGTREVGAAAFETTAHTGLQVYTYTHLIEVIDEDGEICPTGEEGEIVITSLSNTAMPFIRYRIGDRAVVGETGGCAVESVQTLRNIAGRVTDSFVKKDGTIVSPFFFMHFLGVVHNSGWLEKTQIIQEDYDKVRVKLVVTAPPPTNSLNELQNSIKKVMGPECRVDFDFVDSIPPSSSGKYRYTISLVSHPDAV